MSSNTKKKTAARRQQKLSLALSTPPPTAGADQPDVRPVPLERAVYEHDASLTASGLPAPHGWAVIEWREDGRMWQRYEGEAIKVIESIRIEPNGELWLHVSVSKPSRAKMPTYEDVQTMRRLFVGEHRECYMIFPPSTRYVNINPVLHLMCNLDRPDGVLPAFEEMRPMVVPSGVKIGDVELLRHEDRRTV